ncbi:DASH complex subunit DAD4 [Histoplasma capsulatum var. duboisii H88]|uniref:DASH complex subunit DAD4 n=1 Tax=Ajellomyces capsulatus (strain H88) TaxID=544711 RepID=A0A8A1LUC4_AJEC8|nr:DASH complex subunit DAD4 [Histoplasma capsulatum var. duboisii H88]
MGRRTGLRHQSYFGWRELMLPFARFRRGFVLRFCYGGPRVSSEGCGRVVGCGPCPAGQGVSGGNRRRQRGVAAWLWV